MKKFLIIIVFIIVCSFVIYKMVYKKAPLVNLNPGTSYSSLVKEPESTVKEANMPFMSEQPALGKYQFVRDYIVTSCIDMTWGDFPHCKDNGWENITVFKTGDVVDSYRAFFDDHGTGWGIGLAGEKYGGSNMRIDMGFVKKVPDATPERYNKDL